MTDTKNAIEITETALEQLIALDVGREQFLRLWVEPGGCSGLSYGAGIDVEEAEGDLTIYEDDRIRVIADPQSSPYFDGLKIDYTDDLVQSGFRFINPNATESCGCGSSFQCSC